MGAKPKRGKFGGRAWSQSWRARADAIHRRRPAVATNGTEAVGIKLYSAAGSHCAAAGSRRVTAKLGDAGATSSSQGTVRLSSRQGDAQFPSRDGTKSGGEGDTTAQLNREELARIQSGNLNNPPAPSGPPPGAESGPPPAPMQGGPMPGDRHRQGRCRATKNVLRTLAGRAVASGVRGAQCRARARRVWTALVPEEPVANCFSYIDRRGPGMKHLVSSIAITAALVIAAPVWAQNANPSGGNGMGMPGPNPGGGGGSPRTAGVRPGPQQIRLCRHRRHIIMQSDTRGRCMPIIRKWPPGLHSAAIPRRNSIVKSLPAFNPAI